MTTIEIPPGPIDHHLKKNRNPGTTFALLPGVYTTRGIFDYAEEFDFCMLAPGCSIQGHGPKTEIRIENPVLFHRGNPTGYTEVLTGGAKSKPGVGNPCVSIRDLNIDASLSGDVAGIGIHLWGEQCVVDNVVVRGIFGNRNAQSPSEGFGILINSPEFTSSGVQGANTISNCAVLLASTDDENYSTGIYMGVVRNSKTARSRIFNCICSPESGIGRGHAAFAANDHVDIINCSALRFIRAFFCDTRSMRNIVIQNMFAQGIDWALDIRVGQGSQISNMEFRDCVFDFEPSGLDYAQAIRMEDIGDGQNLIAGIYFNRSTFTTNAFNASMGRTRGPLVSAPEFRECRWIGRWQLPVTQEGAEPWY